MLREPCSSTDPRTATLRIVDISRWLCLLVSVLAFLAVTVPAEAANTLSSGTGGGGGTISGFVNGPGGAPLANASVEACPEINAATVPCSTVATGPSGDYSINGLATDTWDLTARPPQTGPNSGLVPVQFNGIAIDASTSATHDFQLGDPNLPPPNAFLVPFRAFSAGIPVIYWFDDLTLVAGGCPNGGALFQVVLSGLAIRAGGMTESPPGSGRYSASVARFLPDHGDARVEITITCPKPKDDTNESFDIYIDPSGIVKTSAGDPVPNATVTLLSSGDADCTSPGAFTPVPDGSTIMSITNRTNPMLTDAAGHFGWDVVKGCYKVRAEKSGCAAPGNPSQTSVESGPLTIPPPVTDLVLTLDPTTSDCTRTLDHFLCYKAAEAKAPKGVPPFPSFTPTTVSVTDQFRGPIPYDLTKDIELCNPANKNDEDPSAPGHAAHLVGYQAKVTSTHPPQPKFLKSVHTVQNQFGVLKLTLTAPDRLFVPSAKALGTGGATPLTAAETIDHLICYKASVAKAAKGQPPFPTFTPATALVTDEFGGPARYDLKKPTRLCAPADKDGGDPTAPGHVTHLVCYQAVLSKTHPPQPKFSKQTVSTNNQFGDDVLSATAVQELCVPSVKLD